MEKRFMEFSYCLLATKKGNVTKRSFIITAGRRRPGPLVFTAIGMTGEAFSRLMVTLYFSPIRAVRMAPERRLPKQTIVTGALAIFRTVWTAWINGDRVESL